VEAPTGGVLDLRLPGLTGLDLQKQMAVGLGNPHRFSDRPWHYPSDRVSMKAGATEFLSTPVEEPDLSKERQKAIEHHRLRGSSAPTNEMIAGGPNQIETTNLVRSCKGSEYWQGRRAVVGSCILACSCLLAAGQITDGTTSVDVDLDLRGAARKSYSDDPPAGPELAQLSEHH